MILGAFESLATLLPNFGVNTCPQFWDKSNFIPKLSCLVSPIGLQSWVENLDLGCTICHHLCQLMSPHFKTFYESIIASRALGFIFPGRL